MSEFYVNHSAPFFYASPFHPYPNKVVWTHAEGENKYLLITVVSRDDCTRASRTACTGGKEADNYCI